MEKLIVSGMYKHYKGSLCKVLYLGRLEEDLDEVVIYQELNDSKEYGKNAIWVRRKSVFLEEVNSNGEMVPRFKYMGDEQK
jgi:cyclomaltodextrinase / maltogenic alpha-amylase / neopullulanase